VLVWIDLSNSPHVLLFDPIVEHLRGRGAEVLITARDHAQTVELAQRRWSDVHVVGGQSPGGTLGKMRALASRAAALRKLVRDEGVDAALSHGSYGQLVVARELGLPAVTMMDYEHQPANHLSFRLARRVVVPTSFPSAALDRFGAGRKSLRYDGYKEDLYLAGFTPDGSVLERIGIDDSRVVVVFRAPPEGALYHRGANTRFDTVLAAALATPNVEAIVLAREEAQRLRYEAVGARVPREAVDARSLLAAADLVIGGGGTMTREAALLGTPTYTVFSGPLAAVDAALMEAGLLFDGRDPTLLPRFVKKEPGRRQANELRAQEILRTLDAALAA
jgi:hypothetical protein